MLFNSIIGTDALLSFESLGLKNDEVITSAFSYISTTSNIKHWLQTCICRHRKLLMEIYLIKKKITNKTKAIIIAFIWNVQDLKPIKNYQKEKITIIEDAAQVLSQN